MTRSITPSGGNDAPLIQAAIKADNAAELVGDLMLAESLIPRNGLTLYGTGSARLNALPSMTSPLIAATGDVEAVSIRRLGFQGANQSGCKGIHAKRAYGWVLEDLNLNWFGDHAILFEGGAANHLTNVAATNGLRQRDGRPGIVGVIDLASTDDWLWACQATSSSTPQDGVGNLAAFVFRGANSWVNGCLGQISQIGFAVIGAVGLHRFVGSRADLNNGPGWQVDSAENDLTNCGAFRNSQAKDGGYSGFVVTNSRNHLAACRTNGFSTDAVQQKHGFEDSTSVGTTADLANTYDHCWSRSIRGKRYSITGSTPVFITDPEAMA